MPAYTEYDSTKPDGGTSPTVYSGDDDTNQRALRDMALLGRIKGFVQSRATGTGPDATRPQLITWLNATLSVGFRMNLTWSGFQISSCQWEWTSGADYPTVFTAMGSAQANTYDGSNNITATTNSGGWVAVFMEVWTKCLKAVSDISAHIAATGTAVHGLGTMSTQAATAVAILGGTIDATDFGTTTRGKVNATRVTEDFNTFTPSSNAGVVVDWTKGGSKITVSGTNAITYSNVPAGLAGHVVEVDNFNSVTWPGSTSFGVGGAPSIAGRALVVLETIDGGTNVRATITWRAV